MKSYHTKKVVSQKKDVTTSSLDKKNEPGIKLALLIIFIDIYK